MTASTSATSAPAPASRGFLDQFAWLHQQLWTLELSQPGAINGSYREAFRDAFRDALAARAACLPQLDSYRIVPGDAYAQDPERLFRALTGDASNAAAGLYGPADEELAHAVQQELECHTGHLHRDLPDLPMYCENLHPVCDQTLQLSSVRDALSSSQVFVLEAHVPSAAQAPDGARPPASAWVPVGLCELKLGLSNVVDQYNCAGQPLCQGNARHANDAPAGAHRGVTEPHEPPAFARKVDEEGVLEQKLLEVALHVQVGVAYIAAAHRGKGASRFLLAAARAAVACELMALAQQMAPLGERLKREFELRVCVNNSLASVQGARFHLNLLVALGELSTEFCDSDAVGRAFDWVWVCTPDDEETDTAETPFDLEETLPGDE